MSEKQDGEREELVIDGRPIRFLSGAGEGWVVVTGDDGQKIGRLALVDDGSRFVAYRSDGSVLTKPSRWGGAVTARFGSRELAVRALLAS